MLLVYGCFRKLWYPQNTPKWSFLVGKPWLLGTTILGNTHMFKPSSIIYGMYISSHFTGVFHIRQDAQVLEYVELEPCQPASPGSRDEINNYRFGCIKKNMYPPGKDHISHLGKRKIIFKMPFLGNMLVPWRVFIEPRKSWDTLSVV